MGLIEKKIASRTDLKWFGVLCLAFFAALGAMSLVRHGLHAAPVILWTIGAGIALVYYGVPPIQRPFYSLWMTVVYPIGWVVSHLMMLIVFYLVITPVGLIMRLCGRDSMTRVFESSRTSYWIEHDPAGNIDRYFRQF